jgi:opacity protein-like surface antigen
MGGTTAATLGPTFSTDAFDLSLSARYQLTSHLDLDAGFQHSDVSSGGTDTSYSRDQYTVGINFTF